MFRLITTIAAINAIGSSSMAIAGRWNSGLPGFIGRPGAPGAGSGSLRNFAQGSMFISMVIGLTIIDPIPHQPCHRLLAVMSRTDAIPQVRQNGPCSLRNRITTIMP